MTLTAIHKYRNLSRLLCEVIFLIVGRRSANHNLKNEPLEDDEFKHLFLVLVEMRGYFVNVLCFGQLCQPMGIAL